MIASVYCTLGLMVMALIGVILNWANGAPKMSIMSGCVTLYWALRTADLLGFIG